MVAIALAGIAATARAVVISNERLRGVMDVDRSQRRLDVGIDPPENGQRAPEIARENSACRKNSAVMWRLTG